MSEKENHFEILIVDDVQKNIQYVGSILSEHGYGLLVATDGLMALKAIEKRPPDLILLDINMPNMNGFETIQKLKESKKYSEIPVIFLTARNQTEDLVKAFEYGAVDYISKPFNSAELVARVKTHLELKAKEKALQEKNETIRELMRMLLHDISNPLTGLKGIFEIGLEDFEFFQSSREMVNASLNGCFEIIRSVREMYSLEDGKKKLDLTDVDLNIVIPKIFLILKKSIEEKNLSFNISLCEKPLVKVDESSFTNSVFANIITNAIKFSHSGSKIEVRAERRDGDIVLSIQDYGIGIPSRILQNLFNFQSPTNRPGTNGEKGTGYGMPLVKKFIESYGGKIEVESFEDGRGTKVSLYLKAVQ